MLKQLLLTALTVLLCNTALAGVVTNPLYTKADFWTSRLPKGEEVIMTPAQIKLFNQKVNQVLPAKTFDLAALPARVDSSVFKKNLTDYSQNYSVNKSDNSPSMLGSTMPITHNASQ